MTSLISQATAFEFAKAIQEVNTIFQQATRVGYTKTLQDKVSGHYVVFFAKANNLTLKLYKTKPVAKSIPFYSQITTYEDFLEEHALVPEPWTAVLKPLPPTPNIENINKAIAIMKRTGPFSMTTYQNVYTAIAVSHTESELHSCGNTACFAGWIAVSPEWREAGGKLIDMGAPSIYVKAERSHKTQAEAISYWLGLTEELGEGLVYGDITDGAYAQEQDYSTFYEKKWGAVTAVDVIAKLEGILDAASKGIPFQS